VPNPTQTPRPFSKNILWLFLALVPITYLGHQIYKAGRDREELREFRQQKEDADAEWPFGKISRVKDGMTVAEAEAIMGAGQKGTVRGEECLAWDYKVDGKQGKVWAFVKDGKISGTGAGASRWFRPAPGVKDGKISRTAAGERFAYGKGLGRVRPGLTNG
jgi:hypothetical protein